jgi:ribose/xylose/arabinose/galactoside ABC-type transport system permease subunit
MTSDDSLAVVSSEQRATTALQEDEPAFSPVAQTTIIGRARDFLLMPNVLLIIAFAVMLVYFTMKLPYFLTEPNLMSVLQFSSATFILAAGFTVIMIGGGIDLSIGAGAVLAGLVAGELVLNGAPVAVAYLGGILAAVATGVTNGFMVAKMRINPLIATLAMLYILEGVGYKVTGGLNEEIYNRQFLFAQSRWFGVPAPVYVAGVMLVITWVLLKMTKLGVHIYALGGSSHAARQCAFNVERFRIGLYTLGAVFTGIGGVLTVALTGNIAPTIGPGIEFAIATAVLLGGVSLSGGRGSIVGALIGVLFIGTLSNGLVQSTVNPELTLVIEGALLITAVAIDQLPRKRIR